MMMRVEEVAMRIGVSTQTLNRWYRFKKKNPDAEFTKNLPDYSFEPIPCGVVRVWSEEDVYKLVQFKANIKAGRTGKMGKYGGTGTHGKKED